MGELFLLIEGEINDVTNSKFFLGFALIWVKSNTRNLNLNNFVRVNGRLFDYLTDLDAYNLGLARLVLNHIFEVHIEDFSYFHFSFVQNWACARFGPWSGLNFASGRATLGARVLFYRDLPLSLLISLLFVLEWLRVYTIMWRLLTLFFLNLVRTHTRILWCFSEFPTLFVWI